MRICVFSNGAALVLASWALLFASTSSFGFKSRVTTAVPISAPGGALPLLTAAAQRQCRRKIPRAAAWAQRRQSCRLIQLRCLKQLSSIQYLSVLYLTVSVVCGYTGNGDMYERMGVQGQIAIICSLWFRSIFRAKVVLASCN